MARAKWDVDGTRKVHAGVSHGMVYPKADGEGAAKGVAWSGLTGVTESPSGAEPTDLWADNMKYARLISGEDYGFTIVSYMYPEEFEPCDGLAAPVKGIRLGQQKRKAFGFSWQTKVGTDEDADTFSWECDTVPVNVTGYKDAAVMEFDSTALTSAQMKAVEDLLYGTESEDAKLPTPDELIAAVKAAV